MLRAVHSHRVEELFGALIDALPPVDPFEPVTIVVGSQLVARWLHRAIAMERGVAGGLDLLTFDRFVERTWGGDRAAREAGLAALDRRRLASALASVLDDDAIVQSLPAVATYLAAAPAPGDRAGPRRVQLAEHLAELAWSYALSRPDWMPALLTGTVPSELAEDAMARWQAVLIGAAVSRLAAPGGDEHTVARGASPAGGAADAWRRTLDDDPLRFSADHDGPRIEARARAGGRSGVALAVAPVAPATPFASIAIPVPSSTRPRGRHWAPTPMLPWLRRRLGLPPPEVAGPVATFGMSFLARAQLEALSDLAQTTDVTVYLLDPCEELWDDVAGRASLRGPVRATGSGPITSPDGAGELAAELDDAFAAELDELADARAADDAAAPERELAELATASTLAEAPPADPLPLVLWGRPVRDTLSSLVERTAGDLEGVFPEERAPGTALEQLLADVRARRTPTPEDARGLDAGATVLACPNARREVEVIAAQARWHLDADPTLRAHELGVWIAGDAEHYLAQAPSAFEAVGVPCHLVDAPIDDRGRIGEAVLALLELPTGDMSRRDLLRVMTHPAVLAGHPHVDAADWIRWTDRLGIAHGSDARAHEGTYLEEHPQHFHWDQGVRRLALGAFMVGERAARGPARIANGDVAPEELRPDQLASAATYALLVRSLCADAAWLAARSAPLASWAEVLAALVDEYLAPRDPEATRDLERVRSMLAGLATLDVDGRDVGFREVREHVVRLLGRSRANRGEPLAAGVMIAPLAAMRAVPFRVMFVAGLDEGGFPAGDRPSPLDLRRAGARLGDVTPRDRDRAAFLDVLLCARGHLYLSYVAVEGKSGQALGPSSVVLELADSLAPYLGAASSRDALEGITVRHPLHRFAGLPSAARFGSAGGAAAAAAMPAVARERWGVAVRETLREQLRAAGHPIPDEDGQLALLGHPSQTALRAALGIEPAPATVAPATSAAGRSITIANLRGFLEYPVQAWAQAVLGLDELPDDTAAEHSDEPFHLGRADRAVVLRDVFGEHVRDPDVPLEQRYDAAIAALQLRGQFPVGVFHEAARTLDLAILRRWRAALGPVAEGATRYGFGRAMSPNAQLRPALEIQLSGGRTVRIIGQTELLLRGPRMTSVVTLLRALEKRSPYHVRGALDHVVLAAAGLAVAGHEHRLLGPDGSFATVFHRPWTQADARAYLGELIGELLDTPHGYLLPFEALVKALAGGKPALRYGDPTGGLGYGPIERRDGLELPSDARAIANRRLAPLVQRMQGDHGFEIGATP